VRKHVRRNDLETRVAVISIIVGPGGDIENLNRILHEYSQYVIGRMGIPYRPKNVNIISVVLDAPQDKTAALAGKIGNLTDITAKTAYSNIA